MPRFKALVTLQEVLPEYDLDDDGNRKKIESGKTKGQPIILKPGIPAKTVEGVLEYPDDAQPFHSVQCLGQPAADKKGA